MQILESVIMAWQSLISNKLRSVLTLLGIAIGLFTILIVMTSIRAIQNSFEDVFSQLGTNKFVVRKYPAIQFGHGLNEKYRNRKDLTLEQGEKLKTLATMPEAIGISKSNYRRTIKYNNITTNPNVDVWGTNLDQLNALDIEVEYGRSLSQSDLDFGRNYCVIGKNVEQKLFNGVDPLDKEIKVDGMVLKVIGVFKEMGSIVGQSRDNFIAIPLTVYTKNFGKKSNYEYLVKAPENKLYETIDEIISRLRILRNVTALEENDFEIVANEQIINQFNDMTKYFKMGSAIIAFIALLAAGVGIMNIMLVSVTERTREIGIRKAVGAKKTVIRFQFILEAIVLSQIGGFIGITFGVLGGNIVASILGVNIAVPLDWIIIGLTITTGVGIIFGSYPAIKASNLDPIEALRYE